VSGFFGPQYYYDTWIVVAYALLLLLLVVGVAVAIAGCSYASCSVQFISRCQKSVRIAEL